MLSIQCIVDGLNNGLEFICVISSRSIHNIYSTMNIISNICNNSEIYYIVIAELLQQQHWKKNRRIRIQVFNNITP